MADPDRRTTIFGDQIKDGTITPVEIETEGIAKNYKIMIYNESTEKFKWFHWIRGRIFQ